MKDSMDAVVNAENGIATITIPNYVEEHRRSVTHAATTKPSEIGTEIRDVRLTVRELVFMRLFNELHPAVKKRSKRLSNSSNSTPGFASLR